MDNKQNRVFNQYLCRTFGHKKPPRTTEHITNASNFLCARCHRVVTVLNLSNIHTPKNEKDL